MEVDSKIESAGMRFKVGGWREILSALGRKPIRGGFI
jgi:hypothetical protein